MVILWTHFSFSLYIVGNSNLPTALKLFWKSNRFLHNTFLNTVTYFLLLMWASRIRWSHWPNGRNIILLQVASRICFQYCLFVLVFLIIQSFHIIQFLYKLLRKFPYKLLWKYTCTETCSKTIWYNICMHLKPLSDKEQRCTWLHLQIWNKLTL